MYEVTIAQRKEVAYLEVRAGVQYWEDATVNGVEDETGKLIPCREDNYWCPKIELSTGKILNWKQGTTADIHYKVCDDGLYTLLDKENNTVTKKEGYVLDMMSPKENGDGDYIIMEVDENGLIQDWNVDLEEFNINLDANFPYG